MTGNEKMPVDKQENHSSSHGGKDDFRSIWFRPHMEMALGLGFQWDVCLCLLVVAYLERRHKRAQVGQVRAAGGKPAFGLRNRGGPA